MYNHITPENINFLRSRPWYQSKVYDPINDKLNKICPHTHVVAVPWSVIDITTPDCVEFNPEKTRVICKKMRDSDCHNNCDDLYKSNKITSVYTGFALSDDGKWRLHSWGIDRNGHIIETTCERVMYYGKIIRSKL